jgi:hypothetical protein
MTLVLASDTTVYDKEQYTMLRHFGKYWKGGMKRACSLVANIMVDKKQGAPATLGVAIC